MRGPRIRRILYATNEAHALAALLAPLTSPAPHDVEVNRWCQRLARTRDWQRLRFSEKGVHLANNCVVAWANAPSRDPARFPGLATAARVGVLEGVGAAVEVLHERGLWPWAPGDVDAPRWWCEECETAIIEVCDGGALATPPSLADLVAVASLGAETLRGVAELVRTLHAVTRGETGATLVWRVMTAKTLREHHIKRATAWIDADVSMDPAMLFSMETTRQGDRWPEVLHPRALPPAPRRWWPILRALAVHENETPTGLHLVAADRTRVVLAVEAL